MQDNQRDTAQNHRPQSAGAGEPSEASNKNREDEVKFELDGNRPKVCVTFAQHQCVHQITGAINPGGSSKAIEQKGGRKGRNNTPKPTPAVATQCAPGQSSHAQFAC